MSIIGHIKKLIVRRGEKRQLPKLILERDQHQLSRKMIHKGALKVLYTLVDAGFEACLVGGCVRDILLGIKPKDFDIATDAEPQQVARLFKHCYIVGRRFCIVHVRIGKEIFEVTTFRARPKHASQVNSNTQGMILSDNVYGTLEEDVWRRDFTVNALYYQVNGFCIVDYTGGVADLENKVLRIIGDPTLRYQEDPVRMLRAIRFAAKLKFTIEDETSIAIKQSRDLLRQVSPARLYLEVEKMLLSGCATDVFHELITYDIFSLLFKQPSKAMQSSEYVKAKDFFESVFMNTDKRLAEGKYVTMAFVIAALLWPTVLTSIKKLVKVKQKKYKCYEACIDDVIQKQLQDLAIPRRLLVRTREIWMLQWQLEKIRGKRPLRLVEHSKFRAAFDFLLLRAEHEEGLAALVDWWTRFYDAQPEKRLKIVNKTL